MSTWAQDNSKLVWNQFEKGIRRVVWLGEYLTWEDVCFSWESKDLDEWRAEKLDYGQVVSKELKQKLSNSETWTYFRERFYLIYFINFSQLLFRQIFNDMMC